MNKSVLTLDERIEYNAAIVGDNSAAVFMGKKITSKTFYVAGLGGASGGIGSLGQLIDGDTKKKVGYSNFPQGNTLPKGVNLLVKGARLLFDSTTSSVTPLIADWVDPAPVAFLNGNVIISQGTNLVELPVSKLASFLTSPENGVQFADFIPFKLRENVPFEIILEAAGTTAATQAWRLELDTDVYTDPAAA